MYSSLSQIVLTLLSNLILHANSVDACDSSCTLTPGASNIEDAIHREELHETNLAEINLLQRKSAMSVLPVATKEHRYHPVHSSGPVSLDGRNATNMSIDLFAEQFVNSLRPFRESRVMVLSGKKIDSQTVWISGVGRSGTTLLEDIVIAAGTGQGVSMFALFEPCHSSDVLDGVPLGTSGAYEDCMKRVLECNLNGLDLFHFSRSADLTSGLSQDGEEMTQLCKESSIRIFKTIAISLTTTLDSVARDSGAHVIRISRDPRATYASQSTTSYFQLQFSDPDELCQLQLDWEDESSFYTIKFLPLKFEDLVTSHSEEVSRLLSFLSWAGSAELDAFLERSMANPSCSSDSYGTCRTPEEAEATLTKWQSQLDSTTMDQFGSVTCERAISIFGYNE